MPTIKDITLCIQSALPDAKVYISTNDDRHFEGVVVSSSFLGKSLVEQHRIVMTALKSLLANKLHAFALKTYTPEAWGKIDK